MTVAPSTLLPETQVAVAAIAWHCEVVVQVGKQTDRPAVVVAQVLATPALFVPHDALVVHVCEHQRPWPAAFPAHVADVQAALEAHLSPVFPPPAAPELEPESEPVPASVAQAGVPVQLAPTQVTRAV
jgi:hypothetical protein